MQDHEDVWRSAQQALKTVRNIYCVGRNYTDHAAELGNAVPKSPMIFGKPTHALVPAEGALVLPAEKTTIHHELEVVLYMVREHQPGSDFTEAVGGIALGLDLTDRDLQSQLKAEGKPWELAKGFRHSAVITDFYLVTDWHAFERTPFFLYVNGNQVQHGIIADMLFSLQVLCDFIAKHFGLAEHDIIYTGTPAGVGPLQAGDELELRLDGRILGQCRVARG